MNIILKLAQVVGVPIGQRSGDQLAMTLVAAIDDIIFSFLFFFPPSAILWTPKGHFGILQAVSECPPRR